MYIGFDAPRVVLSTSGTPPYMTSVGVPEAEGVTALFLEGHPSEMPNRSFIPAPLARKALRHFYEAGQLLPEVVWEEL